ncbi:uncharacterized protein [Apostichopus japonicus]|uniref:uncharacterized protein isoform X2 n=1 Tax=Stichopus japonicus TaxID=307972 RepID=UPI003AB5BBF0
MSPLCRCAAHLCLGYVSMYLCVYATVHAGKVTSPMPVCFRNHNTTIRCSAALGEGEENNTVCLNAISSSGANSQTECGTGYVSLLVQVTLANYIYDLCANSTGANKTCPQLDLSMKVVPNPPVIVYMVTTGIGSFDLSFRVPEFWDFSTVLKYQANYTQEGIHDSSSGRTDRKGNITVFDLSVHKKPFSLVCVRIKLKYGYDTNNWSAYSNRTCRHTQSIAPSKGPRISKLSQQVGENHEFRSIRVSWEPPEEEFRNGIIVNYSVTIVPENNTGSDIVAWTYVNSSVNEYEFRDVPSYSKLIVRLIAWTVGGASPESNRTVFAEPQKSKAFEYLPLVFFTTASFVGLLIIIAVILIVRRKVLANHLPEPHVINPSKIPTYRTKPPPKEIFDTLKLVSDQPEFDRQDPSVLNKLENCIPGKERRSRTSEDSGLPSSPCQSGFDFPSHQNGFVFETSGKKQEEVTCTYTGLPYEDAEMQLPNCLQESGTNAFLIGNVAPSFEDARNEGECLENRLNDSAVNSHRYARPISSRLIDHKEGYVPMARHDRTLSIEGSSMSESRVDTESSEGLQSYTCMSSYAKSGNEHEQVA